MDFPSPWECRGVYSDSTAGRSLSQAHRKAGKHQITTNLTDKGETWSEFLKLSWSIVVFLGWQNYQITDSSDRLLPTVHNFKGCLLPCIPPAACWILNFPLNWRHWWVCMEIINHHTKTMEMCPWVKSWYLCVSTEITQAGKLPQLNRRHKDNRLWKQRENYLQIVKEKK